MSKAMRRASFAMIPLGVAGVPWGIYEAITGAAGALVALVAAFAAALAVIKIRTS